MKVVSLQLPGGNTNGTTGMDRLTLPFNASDLLWRYPLLAPPPSPLGESKTHLPPSLSAEPRLWSREDVVLFLKWCEREFDLPKFDMDLFQMNGKALCLLKKADLAERCPGAGDVLHNALAMVAREGALLRYLPASPVTPTPRTPYPASPHTHPPTPTWPTIDSFNHAHFAAPNSVTLSPAPSVDSQAGSTAGSPQRAEPPVPATYVQTVYGTGAPNKSEPSNNWDSDGEQSPSYTQGGSGSAPRSPKDGAQASPAPAALPHYRNTQPREFFPSDMPEPNTSGRLLWDFLQQLLNDPSQRYTNYIAWKNRETGVFKIVDPAGLAKLWGIQKNHLSMNYDKMSRALRYYYRVSILRKVQGERHCYQFLRNPTELKNIKNISLLRQQMCPTRVPVKPEPKADGEEVPEEEMPTDLSMGTGEPSWRKRPHPDTPADKHRISSIIGESSQPPQLKIEAIYSNYFNFKSEAVDSSCANFSDLRHQEGQYDDVLNLKVEKCEQLS